MLDLSRFPIELGKPVWDSTEREPDPTAYRLRKLMEQYLTESHRLALEDKYFLCKSTAEMARQRGSTERAVRGLLERARRNLTVAVAEHGHEVIDVPQEEL